ncbi:MAG: M20/M25/M40 family metallo-hydrolase, partial [Chloroflexia bacterium]|nr:M20/M25/M40 family metallo-hydrolase [Chloroflexia bacterium]
HQTTGQPPVNLTFLFEGEEEIGSPHLAPLLAAKRELLAADVVLSVDGGMEGPDTPSLTVASKGLAACQIDLTTSTTDLHSGVYGGTVPNAARAIATLVASFHDDAGRVAVAGFYDDARDLTAEDRAEIAAPPDDDAGVRAQAGVDALTGEAGYSPRERMWARPTLDVNGLWSGFQGAGTKTVTPARAHAKITCRLVPDQDPARILDLIERHVAAHLPAGATAAMVRFPGSAYPAAIRRDHPALEAAKATLRQAYGGTEPLITRTGGTVPAIALLQRILGAETVSLAFSLPGSRMHAPNEWFRVSDFHQAPRVFAAYLTALAATGLQSP